jgi:hypothetical protein
MRPRKVAFLAGVALLWFANLVVISAYFVRQFSAHERRNPPPVAVWNAPPVVVGGEAFAPDAPVIMGGADGMIAPGVMMAPGAVPAQAVAPEALAEHRGPAVDTAALRVSGPVSHNNLSVYFIHGPNLIEQPRIITLQSAIAQNLAVVHDSGFGLAIDNRSDQTLFIQSGDIVKGGIQDRVLPSDYLISPGQTRVPVAAFCVESGRSGPRAGELSTSFQVASAHLPTRDLKLAALHSKAQGQIWSLIAQTQTNLGRNLGGSVQANLSRTSLQLSLEHPRVQEAAGHYVAKLHLPGDHDVIGVAVAINGRLQTADVYASSDLFREIWPKLLHAHAVAALAERQTGAAATAPEPEAVRALLAAPANSAARLPGNARTHLLRQESAASVRYDCCDSAQGNLVVHASYFAR